MKTLKCGGAESSTCNVTLLVRYWAVSEARWNDFPDFMRFNLEV
jgi:hypothetical protein